MIFGRQPAFWIGVAVSLILGAVATLTGNGLISDVLQGKITDLVNAFAQLLVLLAPIITGLAIKPTVTPVAAPQLPTGTVVKVTTAAGEPIHLQKLGPTREPADG